MEMKKWGNVGNGEMGKWRNGKMEKWGNGEIGMSSEETGRLAMDREAWSICVSLYYAD